MQTPLPNQTRGEQESPSFQDLQGIPETMLIPLWARAAETQHARPIIRDPMAQEILSRIDYDFSKFRDSRLTQVGVSVRTMLLDRYVGDFLSRNKEAVLVNLGAGLDTRRSRLGAGNAFWYELDLPEIIALRRKFFPESDSCRYIAQSLLDLSWMDAVHAEGKPVLLIAEGLCMYFPEEQLQPLFRALAERFPGAEMLLELLAPFLVGKSKHHETVKMTQSVPEFLWGPKDCRVLRDWHPGIDILDEWNYFNFHKNRWGWFGYLARLPVLRTAFASRIAVLRFEE